MLCVLLLDTLRGREASVSGILKDAYSRRDLPIKRLAAFGSARHLLEHASGQIGSYDVFAASFAGDGDGCVELAEALRARRENISILYIISGLLPEGTPAPALAPVPAPAPALIPAPAPVQVPASMPVPARPSGALSVPLDRRSVYRAIEGIYAGRVRAPARGGQPVFTAKSGSGYFSVEIGDISFFESRGKKIAVRARGQDILFYSNFEDVLGRLPGWFVRCHKGYVVNSRQIAHANFAEMSLKLNDQATVPVSRTYRDGVRSLLKTGLGGAEGV